MIKKSLLMMIFVVFATRLLRAQNVYTPLPGKIQKSSRYLFYLHGRIVEEQGAHAVSPDYGSYEYLSILDTLSHHGFIVISEVRPRNTDEDLYAEKLAHQIDSLLKKGVPAKNIYILGASKGAYITLLTSKKVQNKFVNYAVIGVCSREEKSYWENNKTEPCGNFLSIYEASDAFGGSCEFLLAHGACTSGFQEVKLNMNNKHGFLYKPYAEWVNPFIDWANKK
jgi:hypothetical protein